MIATDNKVFWIWIWNLNLRFVSSLLPVGEPRCHCNQASYLQADQGDQGDQKSLHRQVLPSFPAIPVIPVPQAVQGDHPDQQSPSLPWFQAGTGHRGHPGNLVTMGTCTEQFVEEYGVKMIMVENISPTPSPLSGTQTVFYLDFDGLAAGLRWIDIPVQICFVGLELWVSVLVCVLLFIKPIFQLVMHFQSYDQIMIQQNAKHTKPQRDIYR